MTFWKTKEFKALQDDWYQRLETLGFSDKERSVGNEMVLKQKANRPYRDSDSIQIESREAYFNIIASRINTSSFASEVDRLVMIWYADGMKIKHICIELEKIGLPRARNTVRFIIRRHEIAWGLKSYPKNLMNRYD